MQWGYLQITHCIYTPNNLNISKCLLSTATLGNFTLTHLLQHFHLPFSSVNIIDPPTLIIIQGITSSLWMPSNYWIKFLYFTSSPSAWRCQGRTGMLCHKCLACSIFNLGCRTTPIFLCNIFNYLCIYHFQAVAWAQAKLGQALTEGLGLASSFLKLELSKARPKLGSHITSPVIAPLSTVNLCLGHPLCPHPTLQPWLQLTHSVPMPSKLRPCPSFQIHQQILGLLGGSV